MKMYWIETLDWVYQMSFDLDPKKNILSSNVINLIFEGLDTHADVYLNS